MADLVTRLKLDDKQFNDNIRKSKRELEQFKNVGKSTGDTFKNVLGNAIGKVAVPLTIATTAMKGFQEVMKSSQRNADFLDTEIYALKQTVDEFFYSLGNGNLKSFLNDLGSLIDKSRKAYQALDQLGNTQISYGVLSSKNQASIAESQYTAKNKFASNDERSAAFAEWKKAIEQEEKGIEQLQADLIEYATSAVASKSSANIKVTLDNIIEAFKVDLSDPTLRAKTKKQAEYGYSNWEVNNARKDWTQEQKDALAESLKQNIVTHTMLQKYTDEELKDIGEKLKLYYSLINTVKNLGREYNETAKEFNNANAKTKGFVEVESLEGYKTFSGNDSSTSTVTVKPIIPSGSIAELEKKIQETKAKLNLEVDPQSQTELLYELKSLESRLWKLKFKIEFPDTPIEELEKSLKQNNFSLASVASVPNMKDFKIPKIETPIKKEDIDINNKYAESLNAIGNIMGSISNATNEGAAAWLSWGANLLTAIAAAIPAIQTMVAAKTAEGAASAGAEAAKTPLVGWLLVGGAIAAALAAFASIPAFADGGIFQSYLTTGDKNLARLNGGEMILNKGQQANLFNLLDKGTPLGNGGNVTFKIEGKQLVGVLNNYNNKRSKVL